MLDANDGPSSSAGDDARHGHVAVALTHASPSQARALLEPFTTPPEGERDRVVFELFSSLALLRTGSRAPATAHVDTAHERASERAALGR